MRNGLHGAARAAWAGDGHGSARAFRAATAPLEVLYRGAVGLRNRAFDRGLRRERRAPVPVVSVGNLAVGGTGKTPLTAWVVDVLLDQGRRPAVVARGYGEDELALHRMWHPRVPVHADPDRHAAAEEAAREGADCVVLDDGFQHRRLARDLDVVLLAAEHRFPGPLLPRGRYREPATSLRRGHVVVLTRKTAGASEVDALAACVARVAPGLPVARARLAPRAWRGLRGEAASAPRGDVLAVSAVAGPETFHRLVADAAGGTVEPMPFPDHHAYGPSDVEAIRRRAAGRPVAVTEKDAVKLEGWGEALGDVRVLALAVDVEEGEALLRERLLEATRP